jgi:hypothetical protein
MSKINTAPGGTGRHGGRRRLRLVVLAVAAATVVVAVGVGVAAPVADTPVLVHRSGAAPIPAAGDPPAAPHSPAPGLPGQGGVDRPPPDPTPASPGTVVGSGQDESDPVLTLAQGRYFLYTSGIPGPPAINVPVVSATTFGAWSPVTDALPALPPWAVPGYTWAPDVQQFGADYVLYFTAMVRGSDPGMECIGDATGTKPDGPFTSISAPFICQADQGGSIDPRVFTDDGVHWMLWKSDQNIAGSSTPTRLWSQRLTGNGLGLTGQPVDIMGPDEPWQGTIVEAPDLVEVGGAYWDFYSGNWFNQPAYAIGAARCVGPAGPCLDTSPIPLLASNDQGQGPGEASVFQDASGIWLLYSPSRSLAPQPDPPRPVAITRLGFGPAGPYLAVGGLPPSLEVLGSGVRWSAPQPP